MALRVQSSEHFSPELQQEGAVTAAPTLNRDQRRQAVVETPRKEARKVPYLSERAGRYYFVRRYPLWMVKQGYFTEPACRVSLKTADRLQAEREARRMAYEFDGLVDGFQSGLEVPHAERARGVNDRAVRPSDVPVLAKRFEALLLHSDDVDRDEKLDESAVLDYTGEVQSERLVLQGAARCGDAEAVAEQARSFLEAEELHCQEGTGVWKQLLKAMMLAQLRALNGIMTRLEGGTVETPPAPAPVRSDVDVDDLDRAFAYWLAQTKPKGKTVTEARSVFDRLKAFTVKTRISALTREEMIAFRANECLRQVGGRPIRPQTVNKLMGLVRAIFTLAVDDLLRSRGIASPLEKMRKEKVKASDVTEKQDLSLEQLKALFAGDVHAHGARPIGGAGEAGYWLPVLGHSTGARMTELAQLSVHEVVVRDGVVCLWLTTRSNDEEAVLHGLTDEQREALLESSLKTGASRRIIPVHPQVLELGFMGYVEHMRKRGSFALFPDIRPDNKKNLSGNYSKWFNGYLKKVGIKRRGVDWISFRHTLKTAMREARIEQEIRDYVQGHTSEHASQDYGRFPPTTLLSALSKLSFPALASVPKWTSAHMRSRA